MLLKFSILEKCFGDTELSNVSELLDDLFNATDLDSVGKENVDSSQWKTVIYDNGTVSNEFLSKLKTELTLVRNSALIAKIPSDILSRVMSILDQQIQSGSTVALKSNASK